MVFIWSHKLSLTHPEPRFFSSGEWALAFIRLPGASAPALSQALPPPSPRGPGDTNDSDASSPCSGRFQFQQAAQMGEEAEKG